MKFIGMFINSNKEIQKNIYYNYDLWHKDTWTPGVEILAYIPLKVSGKNYNEKQEDLRQKAIEYQKTLLFCFWSCSETVEITDFFYKNGKRYGLLREFKENGII